MPVSHGLLNLYLVLQQVMDFIILVYLIYELYPVSGRLFSLLSYMNRRTHMKTYLLHYTKKVKYIAAAVSQMHCLLMWDPQEKNSFQMSSQG